MTTSAITSVASPSIARRLAYPAVLLANGALLIYAIAADVALESVTLPALLASLGALFVLERWIPHRRSWNPSFKEGLRDFFYFGMNGGIDVAVKMGLAFAIAALASGGLVTWHNGLPFWPAALIAILIADFAGYWLHRWGHHGWLWKVHGVHHTPDKVNTWNNNTIHFINTVYSGLSKTLPLWLLGFAPDVIVAAAYVSTLWSFAVHANVDVDLGWFDRLVMSPVHHRLHHSTKIDEAGNFATVTTLWDRLFGTFVYEPGLEPVEVGVVEPETFPAPNAVLQNQLHPFVDQSVANKGGK